MKFLAQNAHVNSAKFRHLRFKKSSIWRPPPNLGTLSRRITTLLTAAIHNRIDDVARHMSFAQITCFTFLLIRKFAIKS